MSDVPLPNSGISARLHYRSLHDLVDRYESDDEPVHYERAAINMNAPDCSSCLKFFGDIGLLNVEEQGVYIPPTYLVNFFNKIGATKEEAKRELFDQLDEYEVFSEILFQAERDDYGVEELAESVAGQVGTDEDEIGQVETFIEILDHLELASIDDESGSVEILPPKSDGDEKEIEEEETTETVEQDDSTSDQRGEVEPQVDSDEPSQVEYMSESGRVQVCLEMTLDLSEVDVEETKEKLDAVQDFLNDVE